MRRSLYKIGYRQLKLIDDLIMPVIYTTKPLIMFTKLKADICRYIAENGFDQRYA